MFFYCVHVLFDVKFRSHALYGIVRKNKKYIVCVWRNDLFVTYLYCCVLCCLNVVFIQYYFHTMLAQKYLSHIICYEILVLIRVLITFVIRDFVISKSRHHCIVHLRTLEE